MVVKDITRHIVWVSGGAVARGSKEVAREDKCARVNERIYMIKVMFLTFMPVLLTPVVT